MDTTVHTVTTATGTKKETRHYVRISGVNVTITRRTYLKLLGIKCGYNGVRIRYERFYGVKA